MASMGLGAFNLLVDGRSAKKGGRREIKGLEAGGQGMESRRFSPPVPPPPYKESADSVFIVHPHMYTEREAAIRK